MHRHKYIYILIALVQIFLFSGICNAQDSSVIKNSDFYSEINKTLREGIENHGGSTDIGRYHFVIALSTGHFNTDQQNALAMTKAAQSIMNTFCVPGDKVTCIAWEQDAWDISEQISLNTPQDLKKASSALPQGNMDGSKGGHDTYRTLTSILKSIENPESSVIIMMTNSHENRGASGSSEKATGKDSPELREELSSKQFASPENTSFTFNSDRKQGGEIFFTFTYPEKMESLDGNNTKRTPFNNIVLSTIQEDKEILPEISKKTEETKNIDSENTLQVNINAENTNKISFPIIPIIIGVIVVGIVIFLITRKPSKNSVKTNSIGKKISFKLENNEFEGIIAEGEIFELIDNEGILEFRKKETEENDENKVSNVMEVSFDKDSNSFAFVLTGCSMSTDPEDLGELKDTGHSRYLIAEGYSATCYISYKEEDQMLSIN